MQGYFQFPADRFDDTGFGSHGAILIGQGQLDIRSFLEGGQIEGELVRVSRPDPARLAGQAGESRREAGAGRLGRL